MRGFRGGLAEQLGRTLDPRAAGRGEVPAPGLDVTFAPPEHLLAMKIVAHRRRDVADIAVLAEKLGLRSVPAARFEDVLRSVYAGEGELQQVMGVREEDLDDQVHRIAVSVARLLSQPARDEADQTD